MGFLEETMDEDKDFRSFIFGEGEERRVVEVPFDDLLMIFKGFRPRLLAYEDFRQIRSLLKLELKRYLKGNLMHVSKVSDEVWANYTKDMKRKPKQKGHTYVKEK